VIPLFMGAFLCATANSLNWMIAGRVMIGIGIGLASGLVPLFISEVRFAPVPASPVARMLLPTRHNVLLHMQIAVHANSGFECKLMRKTCVHLECMFS